MSFEFYCYETASGEGFEAKGVGLGYYFDSQTATLDIKHLAFNRPLLLIDLGKLFPRNPSRLASFIEKTSQIYSLVYSNYQTTNLCDTVDIKKLVPILQHITEMAELAHEIDMINHKHFCEKVAKLHTIKTFKLGMRKEYGEDDSFYCHGEIVTSNNNKISAYAGTTHKTLARLSDKIAKDLIPVEVTDHINQSAQSLLALSVKLTTIAHLLDDNFDPSDNLLFGAETYHISGNTQN